jgi:hypothetical protein
MKKFTTGNSYLDDGVERYIMHGIPGGSFLTSVLEGDVERAELRADYWNKKNIVAVMESLNKLPYMSYGSPEKVYNWQCDHSNVRSDYVIKVEKQRYLDRLAGLDYDGYIF